MDLGLFSAVEVFESGLGRGDDIEALFIVHEGPIADFLDGAPASDADALGVEGADADTRRAHSGCFVRKFAHA